MFKVSRTLLLVAEGSCESLGFCSPWEEDRDKLLEGGGFGSSTGCSSPYSDCFTQRPCSLVPTAEEVMTRLVNTLTLSVENAQKWLMKTEVSLKEEGEEPSIPDSALGLLVLDLSRNIFFAESNFSNIVSESLFQKTSFAIPAL